jgi:hypothetical protein
MSTRFFPNYNRNYITSRFGNRKWNGSIKHHNGIDLVALTDKGSHVTDYITAHTGGTVEEVGYNDSVGHFVSIRVRKTTVMVYYHLKAKSKLKEGETIKKGATIGYMGSTGKSTGAHLHFGIKENGKWIDPEPYLDADYPAEEVAETCTVTLPILKKGDKAPCVERMQQLLLSANYKMENNGKTYGADGSYGGATDKTVRAYQKDKGIPVTGKCDEKTWKSLLGV